MKPRIKRRNYFIDRSFQAKFAIKFCVVVLLSSILAGAAIVALSGNSTTVAIENTKVVVKGTTDFLLPLMIQTLIIVTIFASVSVIALSLLVSHKISGPLFSLRRTVDSIKNGNLNAQFHIRRDDQIQALADSLNGMAETLSDRWMLAKEKVITLNTLVEDPNPDKQRIQAVLNELDESLNYFQLQEGNANHS
ncbi:MAG: HAMP domain-containing protein [Candidatus Omnitrophica bacterium]|nr:HAMP domain-containing protein [Candidatus Omnitrophota bacterium]